MEKYEVLVRVRLELEGVLEVDAASEEEAEALAQQRIEAGEFHPQHL